jgi:serine/threonine protein kinase
VLHFDIRKENIVCNISNNIFTIKLIDFGTSKIHFHEQKIYGQLGTLVYLPPEIIKGEKYSEKTDIWVLGILAYYLLYGVQLFEGNSINEIKNNIVSLQIPIDTTNQDKQFQQINKIIVRCLERDKHKRAKIEEISTFL